MTYLQLINKVMRGLRERQAAGVADNEYVELVAQFVNDAKEEIEDMGPWYALRTTINDTLVAGTSTLDLTPDTNERSYLLYANGFPQAFITTADNERRLTVIEQGEMDALRILTPDTPNNTPCYVSFSRATGGVTAQFFPTPDIGYTTRFVFVVPQDDLVSATESLSIPAGPVWRKALLMAMSERGEEFADRLDRFELQVDRAARGAMLMDFGADTMTFQAE